MIIFFFKNCVACPDMTMGARSGERSVPTVNQPASEQERRSSYTRRGGEYSWEFKARNCFLMDSSPEINE